MIDETLSYVLSKSGYVYQITKSMLWLDYLEFSLKCGRCV
jgi:hypothetical protein